MQLDFDKYKEWQFCDNHYCEYEPVAYSDRGRPKKPRQMVDPELKYAEVIKRKEGNKLAKILTGLLRFIILSVKRNK